MTGKSMTSRRSFLKSGAVVAAPVAIIATPALAAGMEEDALRSRLARMEDSRAIETLNRRFVHHFNAADRRGLAGLFADGRAPELGQGIAGLVVEEGAQAPEILLTADGNRASATYACRAEVEQALEGSDTLMQMARLQGNSAHRMHQPGQLKADYVRRPEGWVIERIQLG